MSIKPKLMIVADIYKPLWWQPLAFEAGNFIPTISIENFINGYQTEVNDL